MAATRASRGKTVGATLQLQLEFLESASQPGVAIALVQAMVRMVLEAHLELKVKLRASKQKLEGTL